LLWRSERADHLATQ